MKEQNWPHIPGEHDPLIDPIVGAGSEKHETVEHDGDWLHCNELGEGIHEPFPSQNNCV